MPPPLAQFIDALGLEEAGVDGGGIFKEFVEAVRRWRWAPACLAGGGLGAWCLHGAFCVWAA